ncbi:MAG: glycosyltransferase family 1 protein [Bacteroidota bacterium]
MKHTLAHIAVNARLLLPYSTEGISRYAHEVLSRMVQRHPEIRFSFLFDRPFDQRFIYGPNVDPYVIPPQARHPFLWYVWFHHMLKRKLKSLQPSLFFSPEFYLSPVPDIPKIAVFHDIAYEYFPRDTPPLASSYLRYFSPRYAQLADHILTVSNHCRQDLIQRYQLAPYKVTVSYNGNSSEFQPISVLRKHEVRTQYTGGARYFLFVGTIQPRKNLSRLLLAFDRFRQQTEEEVKLLIVGKKGWQYRGIYETHANMRFREDVIFTGPKYGEELNALYAASIGLTFVPYFEGFGLPILEAMCAETAIICASVTCMPEVYGRAALEVDPFHPEEISAAMLRLSKEPLLREMLIRKGRSQRQKFSWDRTYEGVWKVLQRYLTLDQSCECLSEG